MFESNLARRILWAVLAAGALALVLAWGPLWSIDRQLRSVCAGDQTEPECAPHGVLDWELAFSSERAHARLTRWRDSGGIDLPGDLRRGLELDRLFIAGYVGLLVAWIGLASACFDSSRHRRWVWLGALPTHVDWSGRHWWLWLAALPVAAGALDVLENHLLARQLETVGFDTSLAWAAGTAATLKFLALLAPMLALATLVVACATRRLWTSRLLRPKDLASVVEKERGYWGGRRARAGLVGGKGALYADPKEARERAPIGLAFSGGGIRSATFNLGVLQALARLRLLPVFDYLSTVSGGGYIGSALSSLLSINGRKKEAAAAGAPEQHEFTKGDTPLFSTTPATFPFASGLPQLDALRASSEFLVGRRRLLSMELLRTVGGPTFGFLYHLVHFGLFLVAVVSGIYLWLVYLMVGKPPEPGADPAATGLGAWLPATGAERPLFEVYREYFREVIGLNALADGSAWWQHPFFLAFVAGGLVAAVAILVCRQVVKALPDEWYSRRGKTAADGRQEDSVLALVAIMLLAAIAITWWFAAIERELLNISVPLVSYLGAGAVLLVRHASVTTNDRYRRSDRSRLAARQGALVYLVVGSFILVLIILPSLVFFEPLKEELKARPVRGVLTWLFTVVGARLFAGSVGGGNGSPAGPFASFLPVARKIFLGVVFTVALLASLILIAVFIWTNELGVEWQMTVGGVTVTGPAFSRFGIGILAAGLYFLTGRLNFNKLALHYFYRDRLAEAYLCTSRRDAASDVVSVRDNELMRLSDLHGRAAGPVRDPEQRCVTAAPYHLIQSCLNLTGGRATGSRKTDRFVFSKLHCGSRTTGFLETRYYRGGRTSVAHAMTISGAAVSPAMGAGTFFAQSAAMTLLNVRLGQWMENPGYRGGIECHRRESSIWWPWYLLKEATASTGAQDRLVYLSDGGHSGDNLGICPLLERRCRLIIAVDAEQDEGLTLSSFNEALRQARIDDGVEVEIELEPLAAKGDDKDDDKKSSAHHAIGRISYPEKGAQPAATGWLVLLKASMTGDEPEPVVNYQKKNKTFPHQTTGDQFFDEAQFESYRELGEHVVDKSLEDELLRLVRERLGEPEDRWNAAFEKLRVG